MYNVHSLALSHQGSGSPNEGGPSRQGEPRSQESAAGGGVKREQQTSQRAESSKKNGNELKIVTVRTAFKFTPYIQMRVKQMSIVQF